MVSFPLLVTSARNQRLPKGISEHAQVLEGLISELRRLEPEVDARAREMVATPLEPGPTHFALAHQLRCRGNVHPDALVACQKCAVCNGIWAWANYQATEQPARQGRGRPRHVLTKAVEFLLRPWRLSHAVLGVMIGRSRGAAKGARKRNRSA